MLQFLAAGARAVPALTRLAGGRAFVQQLAPSAKDAIFRYGPELGFALLNASQVDADATGKGIAFGESLAAGLVPSLIGQRIGFSAGHRRATSKGLLHGTPEFNQKVGEYMGYGDMAGMVPSFLYPMPLTQGLYQKEAERQQALAQQQQLEPANGIAPLPSGMSGLGPPQRGPTAEDPLDEMTRQLAQQQIQEAANSIRQTPGSFTRMAAIPGFDSMFNELNELNDLTSPQYMMRV